MLSKIKFNNFTFLITLIFIINFQFLNCKEKYFEVKVISNSNSFEKNYKIIANNFDHENFQKCDDYNLKIIVSQNELEILKKLNLEFIINETDLETKYSNQSIEYLNTLNQKNNSNSEIKNFKFGTLASYYKLDEIYSNFGKMKSLFPQEISIDTIGFTYENRPIIAYHFNFNKENKKNQILITSLHHAREPGSALSLVYTMWNLLEDYQNQISEAMYLLNNRELILIPCVNPDGYYYNQISFPNGGGLWRKNRSVVDSNNIKVEYGVDLNRNYGPFKYWDYPVEGSSLDKRAETYRGEIPFSENETKAIRDLCLKNKFKIALNFHSWGELIITPFGLLSENTKDSTFFQNFGLTNNLQTHFVYGKDILSVGYNTRGTSDDWMYNDSAKYSFVAMTPELGNQNHGFWPINQDTIILIAKKAKSIIYQAIWSADGNPEIIDTRILNSNNNIFLEMDIRNIGREKLKSLKIFVETDDKIKIMDTVEIIDFKQDEKRILKFQISFVKGFISGTNVKYKVHFVGKTINSEFEKITEIKELSGEFDDKIIFNSNMIPNNWKLDNWGLEDDYITGDAVLTDSPYRTSFDGIISSAEYNESIFINPNKINEFHFLTRFNIEKTYDEASILFSIDNGNNWKTIQTNRTHEGIGVNSAKQKQGNYYYHGHINEWITQKINLDEYKNKNLKFKFEVNCDKNINYNGLYITNIFIRNFKEITNYLDIEEQDFQLIQEKNIDLKFLFNNGNDVFIEVFDILGNNIISTNVHSFDQLNSLLNVYPKTAYMLQYKYKNKSFVEKFLNLKF